LHKSALESAIYDKLKKGPEFEDYIEHVIPREILVDEVRMLITPTAEKRLYPLIVGEHGTGKTSLIKLAVNGMNKNEPKGVVYVDIPIKCDLEIDITKTMLKALGCSSDQLGECDYSSSLSMSIV